MAEVNHHLFQREPGKPAGFYLHWSIKNQFQRENLTKKIEEYGGKVLDDDSGADTVLVDEKRLQGGRGSLQIVYSVSRNATRQGVVVEPMRFVQDCIRRGVFLHDKPVRQGMGGNTKRSRTKFTEADDDHLCWYISRRIPNIEDGGRFSVGFYEELIVAAQHDESLDWALRHTAESWRERYRKNRLRLDPIIREYARRYPPEPPALYIRSRRYNKNPKRALKSAEPEDEEVIEVSDVSMSESEEDSETDTRRQWGSRSPERNVKSSKRRRIDSSDISSPAYRTPSRPRPMQPPSADRTHVGSSTRRKGKGKAVDYESSESEEHDPYAFSPAPAPDLFEPGPSQTRPPAKSPVMNEQRRTLHETPPPSATLVNRASPIAPLPTNRRAQPPIPPSPHPSTSFHNVVHSSPIFTAPTSANRSGTKSHNTSATEPSSRSMVVPSELALPTNAPAESSITRESSHKRSSPIPPPMRKAVRKYPSQRPPISQPAEDKTDRQVRGQQETQWAPYKNTRSRSHSVEPVPLPSTKKRGRRGNVPRNDAPLDPVHEGDAEHERELEEARIREGARGEEGEVRGPGGKAQEENQVISVPLTETLQEEQNVADLLMLDPNDTSGVSEIVSGGSKGAGGESENEESGEETEDEGEGEMHVIGKKEEEEEEEKEDEEESEEEETGPDESESEHDEVGAEEETAKFETARGIEMEFNEPRRDEDLEVEDDGSTLDAPSDAEEEPSIPEVERSVRDVSNDPSSDVESIPRASSSVPHSRHSESLRQRQPPLESDDAQIDQMIGSPSTVHNTPAKTAQEVLALYDSSPETPLSPRRRQRKPFNTYQNGSPSPLHVRNQNRPHQSFPISKPTQMQMRTQAGSAPRELAKATPAQGTKKLAGPRRVSSGSSLPSSVGTLPRVLPRTPVISNTQPAGLRARSPLKQSLPIPQQQSQQRRLGSIESTSSAASFPLSGTRASAVKQQMEQELKESPYTPPSGTKAAQIAARQRVLRPRKR